MPYVRLFRWFDALEHRWTDLLTGEESREPEPIEPPHSGPIEDLS
jgi:hypothetical protein